MRLLPFALPLFFALAVRAAPTAAPPVEATSIQTITENVTRTIIHYVTPPSPTAPIIIKTNITYDEAVADLARLQLELDAQKQVIADLEAKTVTASPHGPNEVPEVAGDVPAVANATETPATLPMCACDVADACRKESMNEMETCMESCQASIESYGSNKDAYLKCFNKFNNTIVEAETCLFKDNKDYCNSGKDAKDIDNTNWDELTSIQYSPATDEDLKDNAIWKKHEPKYTKMQEFFTCTKNCMHKKLESCSATKNCAVKMPTKDEFETKMSKCTKDNVKLTTAILNTCTCLAWTEKVEELQGSCVFLGNQYYVDRA